MFSVSENAYLYYRSGLWNRYVVIPIVTISLLVRLCAGSTYEAIMKIKNIIAAICGVILIACMTGGIPVFAAEPGDIAEEITSDASVTTDAAAADEVVYIDIDGDGQINQAERDYADALKAMQDYLARYSAREAAGIYSDELLVPEDILGNEALLGEEAAPTETDVAITDQALAAAAEEPAETVVEETPVWDGTPLNKDRGTIYGPSGKEVYYNLNMTPVINIAQQRGIEGSFWVRSDGVKMYGNYVMVAANYDLHPYGSLVETSLGTAIVLDTGGFAALQPTLIDVAVRW